MMKNIRRDFKGIELVINGKQPFVPPEEFNRLSHRLYDKLQLALPSYVFDHDDMKYDNLKTYFFYLIENIPACITAFNMCNNILNAKDAHQKFKAIDNFMDHSNIHLFIHNSILLGWSCGQNDSNFANTLIADGWGTPKESWWTKLFFDAEIKLTHVTDIWQKNFSKSLKDTELPLNIIDQMVSLMAPIAADCELYINYIDELFGAKSHYRCVELYCVIYELIIKSYLSCVRIKRASPIFTTYVFDNLLRMSKIGNNQL